MPAAPISDTAINAIGHLTDAADAFVAALKVAANQDTDHPGYWKGFIAQIKHVTEHGGAALLGPEAVLLARPQGDDRTTALAALHSAEKALLEASETAFHASRLF